MTKCTTPTTTRTTTTQRTGIPRSLYRTPTPPTAPLVTRPDEPRKPTQVRTKIQNEPATYQAGVMGLLGMSTKAIAAATHMSEGRVAYRLQRGGVKRSEYRDGTSPVAQFMLGKARVYAQEQFTAMLRGRLKL